MKTTKKLLSLLAIAAMTIACSSSSDEPEPPGPGPENPPIVVEPTDKEIPADSNPDKFDNFFKRTMVVDHTGTGCGYCPFIVVALNKAEESADADKIVPVAAHTYNSNDPMYNTFATKYKNACGVNSYPIVNLDLRKSSDATISGGDANAKIIAKCDALETKYPAKVAIAAAVELVGTDFIVHTGVKVGVTGTYNIGIVVLEDGIKAKQSNNGAKGYDFNTHKHAVRGGLPSTSVTGQPLREGTINAGELIKQDFTVPVPAKTKAENAKIVVYVACPDTEGGTKFYINNVVVTKPGKQVAFKYK